MAGTSPKHRAPRRLPFGMPPRGYLLAGWAMLPLRAFLGVVFVVASLQKFANPGFFGKGSGSIYAQMVGSIQVHSPISSLLGHLLQFSSALGVLIALGELAVGLGILLGLWTRIAAIGGMALSLSLWLTISFNASPWFTSADLVYLFAFTPLVIAGAGGVLSLDAMIARRANRELHAERPEMVVIAFAEAQAACGSFDKGRCKAIPGRTCAPSGCPYLEGVRMSIPAGRRPDGVDRRTVVLGAGAAVAAGVAGVAVAGATRGIGGALAPASPSTGPVNITTTTQAGTTTTTGGTGSLGTPIGPASAVPVGAYANPTVGGLPAIVVQPSAGKFVCYDAVCPHAGCTVGYSSANNVIACPCHGSLFNVETGAVEAGPAPTGLAPYTITESGGQLYVKE